MRSTYTELFAHTERRNTPMLINSKLLAIDPYDCGCTECITGVYKPLVSATEDDIQALFLGIISDHTSAAWTVTQQHDDTFIVTADYYDNYDNRRDQRTFHIAKIAYPITVDTYTLDLDINTVIENLVHLTR
jgi:hypothetical protein